MNYTFWYLVSLKIAMYEHVQLYFIFECNFVVALYGFTLFFV